MGPNFDQANAREGTSRSRQQITRFLLVGGSSVVVDLACYNYLLGQFDPLTAKGISYLAGMLIGFVGNKLWTFESHRNSISEPAFYILVYGMTLLLNIGTNSLAFEMISAWSQSDQAGRFVAFLIATGVTTVVNFLGLKYIAFRQTSVQTA